jgi:carboxyl-terminal processing protease
MSRACLAFVLATLLAGFLTTGSPAAPLPRAEAESYARQVMEAIKFVSEEHVKQVYPCQQAVWAVRGLYEAIGEKPPAEVESRIVRFAAGITDAELVHALTDIRMTLDQRNDLADGKDLSLTLKRMLVRFDPYSTYISAEEGGSRIVCDLTSGIYFGIGVQLRTDPGTKQLLVETPLFNGPAHRAGLQTGDRIVRIVRSETLDGKPLNPHEILPTQGLSVDDVQRRLRGKKESPIVLVVVRDGVEKEITVRRGPVVAESLLGFRRETETAAWSYWADEKARIAYFRVPSLDEFTDRDLQRAMARMKAEPGGVRGLVLDLRFNQGGYLTTAVKLAGLFLDGKIVTITPRIGNEQTYTGKSDAAFRGVPVVCLVNGDTVAGGEIISAALQDHARARIIGERSHGKGSIQFTQKWGDGRLAFTVASFERPSGKSLNRWNIPGEDKVWGVVPDQVIPLADKDRAALAESLRQAEVIWPAGKVRPRSEFVDRQLAAALEHLRARP